MSGQHVRWISEGPLSVDKATDALGGAQHLLTKDFEKFVELATAKLAGIEVMNLSPTSAMLYYPRDVYAVCILWMESYKYCVTSNNITNSRYGYGIERSTLKSKLISKAIGNVARGIRRMTDEGYIKLAVEWYNGSLSRSVDAPANKLAEKARGPFIRGTAVDMNVLLDDLVSHVFDKTQPKSETLNALAEYRDAGVDLLKYRTSVLASKLVVPIGHDYAVLDCQLASVADYKGGLVFHRFDRDTWDKKLYAREQLPDAVQARMAVLDMVDDLGLVDGVGARVPMGYLPIMLGRWGNNRNGPEFPTTTKSVYFCSLSVEDLNV